MALSTPRIRPFSPGHIPTRLLLLGLAGAVAVGGAYVAVAGNPLARSQQPVAYQTSAVSQGTVQVTVSATGPVTIPASVPLSFPNSGKLNRIGK
jgi:multidrug efflux pump subunit AcrA (membrane-fusion protein)